MIVSVVALLIAAYATWLTLLYVAQDWMLFPRSLANGRYAPAPRDVETWTLVHPDGVSTQALVLAAQDSSDADGMGQARPTLVLFHGNAMLAQDWIDWGDGFARDGWNVVIPEFRGYGASGGAPGRSALVEDAVRLMDRLVADGRVDATRIVFYGRSIGGMIAAEAAAALDRPPAALIVHTCPATIADLARRYGAPRWLLRNPFDAERALGALGALSARAGTSCRILVIAHRQDEIVPAAHAERLARAAGTTALVVDGDHNGWASERDALATDVAIDDVLSAVRTGGS